MSYPATYERRFTLVGTPAQTGQAANLSATLLDYTGATLASLTGISESPAGSGCYYGDCAAFNPAWMGRCEWLFTAGPYSGRAAYEDFGTTQGPHVTDGVLVIAQGGTPSTQPAIYGTQALGWAIAPAVFVYSGEAGASPETLATAHPYSGTTLATWSVDQYGNRSNMQILVQPS